MAHYCSNSVDNRSLQAEMFQKELILSSHGLLSDAIELMVVELFSLSLNRLLELIKV